jgi:acyl-homoserine lactone acylase PvdQ
MIVVGEQCVLDGHGTSLEREARKGRKERKRFAGFAVFAFLITSAPAACRRAEVPHPPLVADVAGTREVAGLSAPVRAVRDRWGVPHIYAQNSDDLFFAQGFVQAQDRLFQMDLWRRSSQGRLAEVLGPNFADRDAMTRRIQYRGDLDVEWASYGGDAKSIATAFVRGVNAWVALARDRPPEEFVLAGWKPDMWTAEDLLNRTDAFVESRDAIEEIFRARLVAALGPRRVSELLPGEAITNVPRGLDPTTISSVIGDTIRSAGAAPFLLGLAKPVPVRAQTDSPSNATDIPLNVRTLPHPSPRYVVHLRAPGWNVIGATAPWLPGVAIGHNEHVAWEAEPIDADTQDVYVEKVNPANPHHVEYNGRWIDTEIIKESMLIRGREKPFVFDRQHTLHGVVVAVDRERHLAFTIRWSGAEPGAGGLAAVAVDRASSLDELRGAVARWKMPARRFVYRDRDGHSGSTIAALVPVRRGWDGRLPAPGWTGTNEWSGWQTPPAASATSPIVQLARVHPDRADALLRDLASAAVTQQRAILVNALADTLRDAAPAPVLFSHVLAISPDARYRFNIGPLTPLGNAPPFAMTFDEADWDRSTAMNAPGQSGSAASAHFSDLARLWIAGGSLPLAFGDAAIQANTESTLILAPHP